MKIVITGGLGYIGTELCKLYSGEARYKQIVVLDSKFVSERVKQLTDWGITFIQGDILDEELISRVVKDADILFHLAGITDVAYTKTQSNSAKDLEIKKYGVEATKLLIKNTPKTCKFIFPSTHVVYEGFRETKFDILEDELPTPVLSYSQGKVQSENELRNSELSYIILRLGTVYGYSTDTMRINIMPNLFSKITALDGTIKLFSGGVQYKSLVSLQDVVRSMKFFAESNFSRETYHISNENMTIKEVAQLCKKYNDKVDIIETDDEIPNQGYTISNSKLLSTGFKFLYNIESSIKEMIQNWSIKKYPDELEFIIKGEKEFSDQRGKITNYELTEPINLIGYIESVRGSVRANHYHPVQEQKCLLIKGKYISVIKDLATPNSPLETRIIKQGEIAVIRPNVAHAMVFLEDSIFLNLVRGEREHENYGITHTIPFILVDEKFRDDLLKNYVTSCRSCGGENLRDVLSLGKTPLANNLLDNQHSYCETYPLEVKFCDDCKNCQLSFTVPPENMFDNYLYVSSTTETFRNHFKKAAERYVSEFSLDSNTLVVDIGSNDGVFLKPLIQMGVKVLGVEPAKNIADKANRDGVETINSYLNTKIVSQILESHGKASLVTASNVFAHSDDLVGMAVDIFNLLNEDGTFILEVQYLLDTIQDMTFDNIYHEHVNYWSVTSLNNFFTKLDLNLYRVEHINTHGGSIRGFVSKRGVVENNVLEFLEIEREFGILDYNKYKDFAHNVKKIKSNVLKNFKTLKSKYSHVVGYGSPAKATTSLNFFGIDYNYLDFTIEDNELKNNKFIPGVDIPIKNKNFCIDNIPQIVIVLAWNFFEEIVNNNRDLVEKGVKFISIKDLQNENFYI